MVIFRPCGTDENFLKSCEKDLPFMSTLRLFKIFIWSRVPTPITFLKILFDSFCEFEGSSIGIFGIIELFRKEKKFAIFFQKMGFLMFQARVKTFFQSYEHPFGYFWCSEFNKKLSIYCPSACLNTDAKPCFANTCEERCELLKRKGVGQRVKESDNFSTRSI